MKTLKEILLEIHPAIHYNRPSFDEVVNIMQDIRTKTLKECADLVLLSEDEIRINELDINSINA